MCACALCVCVCSVVVGTVGPGVHYLLVAFKPRAVVFGYRAASGDFAGWGCAEEGVDECGCRWATWNWHGEYSSHFIHWQVGGLAHRGTPVFRSLILPDCCMGLGKPLILGLLFPCLCNKVFVQGDFWKHVSQIPCP